MKELAADGVTTFYTTHNIEEANLLCHRVAIISQGRLAAVDTPEHLKATIAESQRVQVAFSGRVAPVDLATLPGVTHVEGAGDKVDLYTGTPGALCRHVVDFARERSLEIVSLNTLGPSLEDVFLRLTGETRKEGR